jgi:hypothetical protein
MHQVAVDETYAAILQPLEEHVDEALRRYALEKVQERLLELEQRVQKWEEKYGCSYDLFAFRTATDEAYVDALNQDPETRLWESDLLAWEFDSTQLQEWRRRLQKLSGK